MPSQTTVQFSKTEVETHFLSFFAFILPFAQGQASNCFSRALHLRRLCAASSPVVTAIFLGPQILILVQLPLQFRPRGTSHYDKFYEEGVYNCAGCGTPLYKFATKFDSGCGWPAFYEGFPGAINRSPDPDGRRTEITCAACGGHLGHVFKWEGPKVPTDERHCVNSVSIKFVPIIGAPSAPK